MDIKPQRKMLSLYVVFHPKNDAGKLHFSRRKCESFDQLPGQYRIRGKQSTVIYI